MAASDITLEELRKFAHYDPSTDTWTRITSPGNKRPDLAGKPITTKDNGYLRAVIGAKSFRLHRLVWLWHHGVLPTLHIDHIDGNRANNRIENLREASRSINAQNQRERHSHNTSGFLGVHAFRDKFMARISLGGKRHFLGYHDTAEAAYAAYLDAKRRMHPGNTL